LRSNCGPKHVVGGRTEGKIEVRVDEEEDVSSYWMTLRKQGDIGSWKRKH